jgi:putrescine transport system ATP-binding protein
VAPPNVIYESPATRFVADFIGSVNLFEGSATPMPDGGLAIDCADGFRIRTEMPPEGIDADRVSFAVRPEKVSISASRPERADENAAEGEIWDIAYFGDMTVYHLRLGNGRIVKASTVNDRRFRSGDLTWHDRAWISFAGDAGVVLTR